MKKLFILINLFVCIFCFSQNPILFQATWQIEKIKYNDVVLNYFVPDYPDPSAYRNVTHFTPTEITTLLFKSFGGSISSVTPTQITVENLGSTLIDSPDPNFNLFENYYSYIFNLPQSPRIFNYTISSIPPYTYNLVLTDVENGNQVYYFAHILATNDSNLKEKIAYPNPVAEVFTIDNLEGISWIRVLDASGKTVIETITSGKKRIEINVANLPKGNYFVKVNDHKTIKIIKE